MALNETVITYNDNSIPSLYQWDYGQVITFEDFDLPETFEVHFAFGTAEESKTVIGQADTVAIPDEFLTKHGKLRGWIFLHEGEEDGETEYDFIINVLYRAKPTDGIPTPTERSVIEELIAKLEEALEAIPEHVLTYDEQTLTSDQQSQARYNINAPDYDSVWDAINETVPYVTDSGRTEAEKAVARANIGAVSASDVQSMIDALNANDTEY